MVWVIVLEVGDSHAVSKEQFVFREPTALAGCRVNAPARDFLHCAVFIWQVIAHLPAGRQDGLVCKDAVGKVRAVAYSLVGQDAIDQLLHLIDICVIACAVRAVASVVHGTSSLMPNRFAWRQCGDALAKR